MGKKAMKIYVITLNIRARPDERNFMSRFLTLVVYVRLKFGWIGRQTNVFYSVAFKCVYRVFVTYV